MAEHPIDRFMRVNQTKFLVAGLVALPVFAISTAKLIAVAFENDHQTLAWVFGVSVVFTFLGLGCLIDSLKRQSPEEPD